MTLLLNGLEDREIMVSFKVKIVVAVIVRSHRSIVIVITYNI